MKVDLYTRMVLTAIAAALLYLCIVFTPFPTASAQTALRPGESTGPAEVVVIGWKAPALPVQVTDAVRVAGEVRVTGNVRTRQEDNTTNRVVLVGWEDRAFNGRTGMYEMFHASDPNYKGLPVSQHPPR